MTLHRPQERHATPALYLLAALAFIAAQTSVASAAEDEAPAHLTVRFAASDLRDQSAARHLLARIGDAALDVCGASPFSLPELQHLVRASSCWHDAVAGAVTSIHAAQLDAAFDAGQHLSPSAAYAALGSTPPAAGP